MQASESETDSAVAAGREQRKEIKRTPGGRTFRAKVIRIKLRPFPSIDPEVEQARRRSIGHGQLLVSGENAHEAFSRLDETVRRLRNQHPPCDLKTIIKLMRLQRDFNRQLLECGEAHLDAADSEPPPQPAGSKLSAPFPPGPPK